MAQRRTVRGAWVGGLSCTALLCLLVGSCGDEGGSSDEPHDAGATPDAAADGGDIPDGAVDGSDTSDGSVVDATPYYVSVHGSADNTGLDESSPWTWEHAATAVPEDAIVHVKAGSYGPLVLTLSQSRVIWQGYRSSPGDVATAQYPTIDMFSDVDASELPLINMEDPSTDSTALTVAGSNVTVRNIQITKGNRGLSVPVSGTAARIENVIVTQMGARGDCNCNTQPYEGFGIISYAANTVVHSCLVKNVGAHAIQFFGADASGSKALYNEVYSGDFTQATDYGILVNSDVDPNAPAIVDVEVAHNRLYREDGIWHGMHAVDFKYNVEGSTMHHNSFTGTGPELSMPGCRYNTIEHNTTTGYSSESAHWHSRILLYNGPKYNVIRNNVMRSTWMAISYSSNSEDLAGYGNSSNTGFEGNAIYNNIAIDFTSFIYALVAEGGRTSPESPSR